MHDVLRTNDVLDYTFGNDEAQRLRQSCADMPNYLFLYAILTLIALSALYFLAGTQDLRQGQDVWVHDSGHNARPFTNDAAGTVPVPSESIQIVEAVTWVGMAGFIFGLVYFTTRLSGLLYRALDIYRR